MRRVLAATLLSGALVLAPSVASADSKLEKKANAIMKAVYGPCFAPIYSGSLKKASVVRTSTETQGVVTVEVFLTTISTGRETTYQFRVNTGLGKYKGLPEPGSGIPTNGPARRLVLNCD
jgi:hypothetical protein